MWKTKGVVNGVGLDQYRFGLVSGLGRGYKPSPLALCRKRMCVCFLCMRALHNSSVSHLLLPNSMALQHPPSCFCICFFLYWCHLYWTCVTLLGYWVFGIETSFQFLPGDTQIYIYIYIYIYVSIKYKHLPNVACMDIKYRYECILHCSHLCWISICIYIYVYTYML